MLIRVSGVAMTGVEMALHWFYGDSVRLPGGWASDAAVALDDHGIIREIQAGQKKGERLSGAVVPGIPNLHSHAFQRGMAGLAERGSAPQKDFWAWRAVMYHFLERLEPEHVEAIAAQAYLEMVLAGYTGVCEFHYLHNDVSGRPYTEDRMAHAHIAAARTAGIALTLVPVLYRVSGFGAKEAAPGQRRFIQSPEGYLERLSALEAFVEGNQDVAIAGGFHSLRAVPPVDLSFVLARLKPELPVHIHVAEQRGEVEECLAHTGRRPVEWLLDECPVSPRWALVHATNVTEGEISRVAKSGATVALCPSTEGNLGDGIFPFWRYQALAGAFGIGTDSHVTLDPAEELRWLDYGQRLTATKRSRGAEQQVGATLWLSAAASPVTARAAGSIDVGQHADFLVLDTSSPALAGRDGDALLDTLVFAQRPGLVRDVIVGGRHLVRDGAHAKADEIGARYRETMTWLLRTFAW